MNYTSIEQSKHLVEAGLPTKTADMYWYIDHYNGDKECWEVGFIQDYDDYVGQMPCWSLGALIELLPAYITTEYTTGSNLFIQRVGNSYGKTGFRIYYKKDEYDVYTDFMTNYDYKNLIDATFETILWLLENNYIKKGETK